jgi:hypothetical protein
MSNLRKYFGLSMVFIYLLMGILLLLRVIEAPFLREYSRLILGIALIVYGLFRAWRVIKDNKIRNEEPE